MRSPNRYLSGAAITLSVAALTMTATGVAHADTKKDIPLDNVGSLLADLSDEVITRTENTPMAAVSGTNRLYFGPNGATQTIEDGVLIDLCLAPTSGKSRCWTRDGNAWLGYTTEPTTRFDGTLTAASIDNVDDVINSMEDYGALTTATRVIDGDTTTVIVSSFTVHPVTGKGIELERREYEFTPTTIRYTRSTDNSEKTTTVTETIRPVARVTVTAP